MPRFFALTAAFALAACGGDDHWRECSSNADCDQGGIPGTCRPSPESTKKWCSYPDTTCPAPAAERWGVLAGDGLAQMCVDQEMFDGGIADAAIDSGPIDAPLPIDATPAPDAAPGEWGAPTIVLNINTGSTHDLQASATADNLEIFFKRLDSGGIGDIYTASRSSAMENFGIPAQVGTVSTMSNEGNPEISPDGLELYFDRLTNVFVSQRTTRTSPWSVPIMLFAGARPALSGDALTLYYVDVTDGYKLKQRTRPSSGSPWSAPLQVVLPTVARWNAVAVSGDNLHLVMSGGSVDFGTPDVVELSRPTAGDDFGGLTEILSLTSMPPTNSWDCDLFDGPNEMYCSNYDATDDLDIYLIRRD